MDFFEVVSKRYSERNGFIDKNIPDEDIKNSVSQYLSEHYQLDVDDIYIEDEFDEVVEAPHKEIPVMLVRLTTLDPPFTNIENNGAPWQFSPEDRMLWEEGLEVPLMAEKQAEGIGTGEDTCAIRIFPGFESV